MKKYVLQYNGKTPKLNWMKRFKVGYFLNENVFATPDLQKAWVFNEKHRYADHFWDWDKEKEFFDKKEVKIEIVI